MHSFKILTLSLLLVACSDKDTSIDIDDTASGFAPQEGTWTRTPGAVDDGCGIGNLGDEADSATLTMNSDGSGFTFLPDEEGDTGGAPDQIECTLDGQDFNCALDLDNDGVLEIDGMDATILQTAIFNGSFSSTNSGSMRATLSMDCDGGDCADVASAFGLTSFPCSTSMSYDLSAD